MAVTSTEQERYSPWLAILGTGSVQMDVDLIDRQVREDILIQERFEPEKTPTPLRGVNLGLIRVNGAYRTMDPIGVALTLKLIPGRRHFRGSELGYWMPIVSHRQELSGDLSIRPDHAIEFKLDTTKKVWPQYLEVFQSEDFVRGIESQVLYLVQDMGRRRMEEDVNQWL